MENSKKRGFVELDRVSKIYGNKDVKIVAVDEISFSIDKGEFVVIVGPSGAGKTTVLNILGGMDQASGGSVWVDGEDIAKYNSRQLTQYRREDIGFVFQFYNLVPNLTALDYQTGKAILKLLQDMCRERGMTVIVITHNSALTPMADKVIRIKNGTVSSMELNEKPIPVENIEW